MLITHQLLSHISCRHHCDSTSVLGKDGKGTVLWSLLPAISGIQCCCLTWLPLIPWSIASEVLLGSSPSCFCSPLRLHGKPGEIGWMNGKLQRGQTECGGVLLKLSRVIIAQRWGGRTCMITSSRVVLHQESIILVKSA